MSKADEAPHPTIGDILSLDEPFGPPDADQLFAGCWDAAFQLIDRTNVVYSRAAANRPVYLVGRKGAGKTAFLKGTFYDGGIPFEELISGSVYSKYLGFIRRFQERHAPLFADQLADLWATLFEHVAIYHVCRTASPTDPLDALQTLWDYHQAAHVVERDATKVVEQLLACMKELSDAMPAGADVSELIALLASGGRSYEEARLALRTITAARGRRVVILMDNLEDLHSRLYDVGPALQGLFRCVGRTTSSEDHADFDLQLCLPSEPYDDIQAMSASPEKDFRRVLPIYWSARELLHLVSTRLEQHLEAHHPEQLADLQVKAKPLGNDPAALLRCALPPQLVNGLGITEDPVAYILRHTQLLPRHAIELLNAVFRDHTAGSRPWDVQPGAIIAGTRTAERTIVSGILNAYSGNYPELRKGIGALANRLPIRFGVNTLRTTFNQAGIRKTTGMEFFDFLQMLFTVGVVGVFTSETRRYYEAQFQYTFASPLTAVEGEDDLCLHPLFTRHLLAQALRRMRGRTKVTYPYGTDPAEDYRIDLGYLASGRDT
jgi:hypothetical protein